MVRLYLSVCPFVWGWYAVVNKLRIPKAEQIAWNYLEANCPPLSGSRLTGGPYGKTQ